MNTPKTPFHKNIWGKHFSVDNVVRGLSTTLDQAQERQDNLNKEIDELSDQLAKAQAVPEGFVLVPVEPKQETIKQMNKVWFESNCAHIMKTKTAELLYKAMIEAQEPDNDSNRFKTW